VAFPGDHDNIARLCHPERQGDRLCAVAHPPIALPLAPAGPPYTFGDLPHDLIQRLGAWILSRDYRVVRQSPRDLAHPRALISVAQPGAPEYDRHPARSQLAHRLQGVLQRVGRVRKIHDHRERLPLVDPFHAPDESLHPGHASRNSLPAYPL